MGLNYTSYVVEGRGADTTALANLPLGQKDGEILEIVNTGSSNQTIEDTSILSLVDGGITLEPNDTVRLRWNTGRWNEISRGVRDALVSSTGADSAITFLEPGELSDHTTMLQNALDDAGHIYLAAGTYYVSDSLRFSNYTRFQLHPEAIIQRMLSMPETSICLYVDWQTHHVIIEGGSLDGNKQSAEVGAGGQCMGIGILGAQDITVRDMTIYDWPADEGGGSYGYGLYLGTGGDYSAIGGGNQRILISNVVIYGCEQNNAFMVTGRDITFENSSFLDSPGDTPGSGLDIEPNLQQEVIQNLLVRNCVFEGNSQGATCNNHYNGNWNDITFDNCTFRKNRSYGMYFTGAALPESNYRIHNCKFLANGDDGLYAAAAFGLEITSCRMEGNEGYGLNLYGEKDFTIANNKIHNNAAGGVLYSLEEDAPAHGSFINNSLVNNGTYGLHLSKGINSSDTEFSRIVLAFNKFGNQDYLKYRAWEDEIYVHVGYRILNGTNIYECITKGLTAASPATGPSGTTSDITDGTAHWAFVFAQPVQDYGMYLVGEGARGCQLVQNDYDGNTSGGVLEDQAGDDNTVIASSFLETTFDGQNASPLTRSRTSMMENFGASPGAQTTLYAAGIAAIAALAASVVITAPLCDVGDIVMITPLDIDTTLVQYKAVAGAGSFTVTGNAAATATWKFAWEIIKAGVLP